MAATGRLPESAGKPARQRTLPRAAPPGSGSLARCRDDRDRASRSHAPEEASPPARPRRGYRGVEEAPGQAGDRPRQRLPRSWWGDTRGAHRPVVCSAPPRRPGSDPPLPRGAGRVGRQDPSWLVATRRCAVVHPPAPARIERAVPATVHRLPGRLTVNAERWDATLAGPSLRGRRQAGSHRERVASPLCVTSRGASSPVRRPARSARPPAPPPASRCQLAASGRAPLATSEEVVGAVAFEALLRRCVRSSPPVLPLTRPLSFHGLCSPPRCQSHRRVEAQSPARSAHASARGRLRSGGGSLGSLLPRLCNSFPKMRAHAACRSVRCPWWCLEPAGPKSLVLPLRSARPGGRGARGGVGTSLHGVFDVKEHAAPGGPGLRRQAGLVTFRESSSRSVHRSEERG